MHQRIVPAFDNVEDGHRAQRLALLGERDFDGIVHAAAGERLDLLAVEPAAKQPRGQPLADLVAVLVDKVVAVSAVAPVEPAVGAEEAAVDIGRIAREAELADQHLANFSATPSPSRSSSFQMFGGLAVYTAP